MASKQVFGPGVLSLHYAHRTISVPVKSFTWTNTETGLGDLQWEETDRVAFFFVLDDLKMWAFEPQLPAQEADQ